MPEAFLGESVPCLNDLFGDWPRWVIFVVLRLLFAGRDINAGMGSSASSSVQLAHDVVAVAAGQREGLTETGGQRKALLQLLRNQYMPACALDMSATARSRGRGCILLEHASTYSGKSALTEGRVFARGKAADRLRMEGDNSCALEGAPNESEGGGRVTAAEGSGRDGGHGGEIGWVRKVYERWDENDGHVKNTEREWVWRSDWEEWCDVIRDSDVVSAYYPLDDDDGSKVSGVIEGVCVCVYSEPRTK